jgi:hypothetical protein
MNDLDRVMLPRERTISWTDFFYATKSQLSQLLQPYEQILIYKQPDKLLAESYLQEWLEEVNSDDVQESLTKTITSMVGLPTFEERAEQAEQLKILQTPTHARVREAAKRVGEASTAYNEHLHMLLQAQDVHEEATRLRQDA